MCQPLLDLAVRNALVATAGDTFRCDIGVADGAAVKLGAQFPTATDEIDAAGRYVIPDDVEAHCQFDQPMQSSAREADDFRGSTGSAACSGTTTIIPFARASD